VFLILHTEFDPSSITSSDPSRPTVTPTGRPLNFTVWQHEAGEEVCILAAGMAGVGKTTAAARNCELANERMNPLWDIRPESYIRLRMRLGAPEFYEGKSAFSPGFRSDLVVGGSGCLVQKTDLLDSTRVPFPLV